MLYNYDLLGSKNCKCEYRIALYYTVLRSNVFYTIVCATKALVGRRGSGGDREGGRGGGDAMSPN